MKLYIIDIVGRKTQYTDEDTVIAEDLILHRDLLRGYTLNYFIMSEYKKFLESIMGKYVIILSTEFDVPDNLTDSEYDDYALKYHNELYTEGYCLFPSTCPRLEKITIENGDVLICTEPMMDYSTETFAYEDLLYKLIYLYDDTIKYLKEVNDECFINFRQFILDGLPARLDDFYSEGDGKYSIDVYSILKMYISELMFIDSRGGI